MSISCLYGEYNNTGTCMQCSPGSYSTTYNASTCTLCPANTYSTVVGATSSSVCISCSPNDLSAVGSAACSSLPLVPLSADGDANAPSKRLLTTFKYVVGGFWIFGGLVVGGYMNDLWRFDRDSRTFVFVDGSNSTNGAAYIANKPTARYGQASGVDGAGNLWIFGGFGFGEGTSATNGKLL
jgi:hypothetical protein